MTFDSPVQTLVSFAALLVWSWWLICPPDGRERWPFAIVWVVTFLLSLASLTYLDLIPGDATRGLQFAARMFLLLTGVLVPLVVAYRHIREPRP